MIYLDYAASTPIDPKIFQEYYQVLTKTWANPSSPHTSGQQAKAVLEEARSVVADTLLCTSSEIVFTSSASESNNTVFNTFLHNDSEIITTCIEHSSITSLIASHHKSTSIQEVSVTQNGIINLKKLEQTITNKTQLISIHLSHNELGVIQPINDIVNLIQDRKTKYNQTIFLHVDASQSPQYIDVSPSILGCDYLTISSQKIYSPRGTSLLYVKEGSPLTPLIFGGGQEHGLRGGTENVASIHAFSKALELCTTTRAREVSRVGELRDTIARQLLQQLPIRINGWYEPDNFSQRIANNIHITLPHCDQESALVLFDSNNIHISAGSACTSGSISTSPAILATEPLPGAHIRISLGRFTTNEDIETLITTTVGIYNQLHS
jgi:cysteine desulfurase